VGYVPTDDGRWVSEQYERLARVVQDYDPQFELRWIPPEHRTDPGDVQRCYVIWDVVTNTPVLYAGELSTPEEILGRLFDSDNKHGNVLDRIDAHNAAKQALEMKSKMDEAEAKQEYVEWIMSTKKNYINLGGGRVVDDQLRRIR
jgi:hypothetical protein